jgi:hypothetical protein
MAARVFNFNPGPKERPAETSLPGENKKKE